MWKWYIGDTTQNYSVFILITMHYYVVNKGKWEVKLILNTQVLN